MDMDFRDKGERATLILTAGIIPRGLISKKITTDRHIHPSFNSSGKQSPNPSKVDATNYGIV